MPGFKLQNFSIGSLAFHPWLESKEGAVRSYFFIKVKLNLDRSGYGAHCVKKSTGYIASSPRGEEIW
jgi:hypothetical protein